MKLSYVALTVATLAAAVPFSLKFQSRRPRHGPPDPPRAAAAGRGVGRGGRGAAVVAVHRPCRHQHSPPRDSRAWRSPIPPLAARPGGPSRMT